VGDKINIQRESLILKAPVAVPEKSGQTTFFRRRGTIEKTGTDHVFLENPGQTTIFSLVCEQTIWQILAKTL